MTKLESYVEGQVSRWCVEQGIMTFKFTPVGRRGWPDRMYIMEGRVAFIEFKADGEQPRALQMHCLELLHDAGIPAIWTAKYDEAVEFLKEKFQIG